MALLRDTPDDFRALVRATSRELEMPEAFVEKDYWATELLRGVAAPIEGMHVVFKGGTSLSKVYGLTRRFSEDIDLLVVFEQENLGTGAKHGLLKQLDAKASSALGVEGQARDSSKGVHRTTVYPYRSYFSAVAGVLPEVKLEAGVRGGEEPHQENEIRSYLAQASVSQGATDLEELPSFRMRVLTPERTLVEKLSLVHNLASRYPGTAPLLARSGRHFYDIWALLRSAEVTAALMPEDTVSLAEDVLRQSSAGLDPSAIGRPPGGFATSPAFDSGAECFGAIRGAFKDIEELLFEPLPDLEDVLAVVKAHAGLL